MRSNSGAQLSALSVAEYHGRRVPSPSTGNDWAVNFKSGALGGSMLYAGGAGTYFDADARLQSVIAGTPRYHYPLPDSVRRGILLENGYTNFFNNSGAMNAAPWSVQKGSIAKNKTGIDNVANSAYTFTGAAYTTGTVHKSVVGQTLTADETGAVSANICLVAYVQKGTERYAALRARTEGQNVPEVVLDLNYMTTHTVSTGGGALKDSGITYLGNLWYMLWMVLDGKQASTTTTILGHVGIAPSTTTLDWGTAGSANKTLIVHSLHMTLGDYPVLPIFNAAEPVARAPDILHAPNTGGVNVIAANNRDLYFELFIPRKPYGTAWKYLYRNGAESLQMNDTGLRWYIDSTNYLAATVNWIEHGLYLLGLEKRSAGATKLWFQGATVASSSAAAYLAAISTGANWYLGSDGTGNHADLVYGAVEYSAA